MPGVNQNEINAQKSDHKRNAGEFEKKQGEMAYANTGWGPYGLFATADRMQSVLTGHAFTQEVAQIRKGERLESEANQLDANNPIRNSQNNNL